MGDRCHRCGDPMTVHFVGDDYCDKCKRELPALYAADARRAKALTRFQAKDLTPRRRGVV